MLSQILPWIILLPADELVSSLQDLYPPKRRRHAICFDDARNTISQKARVGESYHQQQIMGSDAAAATESKIPTTSSLIFFRTLSPIPLKKEEEKVSPPKLSKVIYHSIGIPPILNFLFCPLLTFSNIIFFNSIGLLHFDYA